MNAYVNYKLAPATTLQLGVQIYSIGSFMQMRQPPAERILPAYVINSNIDSRQAIRLPAVSLKKRIVSSNKITRYNRGRWIDLFPVEYV